ncbi:MAG TPA: rhomboid family intramembrane serine protease [Flavipsychrobacter sp.]|nr:rhomboid family intramembrane serine protease [Flavipsychrobacter sp.]
MKPIVQRIKLVYLPFLAISVIILFGYSLLRWLVDIKWQLFEIKSDIYDFWIPFGIAALSALVILRKRIKILNLNGKKDNGYFFYQFIAAMLIAGPVLIFQFYLETASYQLINIQNIEELNKNAHSKYYRVDNYQVLKSKSLSFITATPSGKYGEDLVFSIYIASPIVKDSTLPIMIPIAWYGISYSEKISNRVGDHEKDSSYQNFTESSLNNFKNYNFYSANYFENISYSDKKDGYFKAIRKDYDIKEKDLVILEPKKQAFNERSKKSFSWTWLTLGIGNLVFFLMVIIPRTNKEALDKFNKNDIADSDSKQWIKLLIPKGSLFSTALLIDLNILLFIIMVVSGANIASVQPGDLLHFGANRRAEVMNGEYWRLLTSIFIHGGLMHLVANMFGLAIAGFLLEPIIKRYLFLASFVITGIISSLASIYWYTGISVGASGAILGLYGIIISFLATNIYPKGIKKVFWYFMAIYCGSAIIFGFLNNTDNAAHLGGLISGIILGLILSFSNRKNLSEEASNVILNYLRTKYPNK